MIAVLRAVLTLLWAGLLAHFAVDLVLIGWRFVDVVVRALS